VSPYGIVAIDAQVTDGQLSARWLTSTDITDTLTWQLTATQQCGAATRSATTVVTVDAA
jgi:hypothetical protein